MAQKEVICPSGMKGLIRGLKVREENMLADTHLQKSGEVMQKVISSCWLETVDPGPYRLNESGQINWSNVLLGDIVYLFLMVRSASYGDEYEVNVDCRKCSETNHLEVEISDLPIKALSPEDAEIFSKANKFDATAPSGEGFSFKLRTSKDAKTSMSGKSKESKQITDMMSASILSVEGVSKKKLIDWIEDLESRDAKEIRETIEKRDCGVETSQEFECIACGSRNEVPLPLDQNFLQVG